MKRWKGDDSHKLFVDGHIISVQWSPLNAGTGSYSHAYIRVCIKSLLPPAKVGT